MGRDAHGLGTATYRFSRLGLGVAASSASSSPSSAKGCLRDSPARASRCAGAGTGRAGRHAVRVVGFAGPRSCGASHPREALAATHPPCAPSSSRGQSCRALIVASAPRAVRPRDRLCHHRERSRAAPAHVWLTEQTEGRLLSRATPGAMCAPIEVTRSAGLDADLTLLTMEEAIRRDGHDHAGERRALGGGAPGPGTAWRDRAAMFDVPRIERGVLIVSPSNGWTTTYVPARTHGDQDLRDAWSLGGDAMTRLGCGWPSGPWPTAWASDLPARRVDRCVRAAVKVGVGPRWRPHRNGIRHDDRWARLHPHQLSCVGSNETGEEPPGNRARGHAPVGVEPPGHAWVGKVVRAAPRLDLALVKIPAPAREAASCPSSRAFDRHARRLCRKRGLDFGFPSGTRTVNVSKGIVAGLEMNFEDERPGSARMPPSTGNSGGMMVDEHGQLVGVPTLVISADGQRVLNAINVARSVDDS